METKYNRWRFFANPTDPRPVLDAIAPWWKTSYGEDDKGNYCSIIVAFLPLIENVKRYWPEATGIQQLEQGCDISFSERFPKPSWWK